ncbi:MAG: hypothetical protein R3349_02410 [Geminicoccaceae bacterium]|nr:hypothetical protein [Geminicoccaceae bacterium]
MVKALSLLMLALITVGCAQTYQTFDPPPLDFTSRPPLLLRVDQVRIQSTAGATTAAGPEAAVPVAPEQAVREMLEYRLRAAGGVGLVQATILEASVAERPLEPEGGLRGYVVEEPVAELLGRLKVRLERLDERGEPVGSLSTAVTRTAAIPESATFVRRQEIAYELVRDLVNDLDVGLISNLQQSFPTLIAPSV